MRLTEPQIRALLDRYEAAETSIAEERQLKAALADPQLDAEFAPYRQWFGGLRVLAQAPAPARSGPWDAAVAKTEHAAADREPALRVVHRRTTDAMRYVRWAVAAALIGVMGFGASLLLQDERDLGTFALDTTAPDDAAPAAIDWSKYEVTDPAEATRITRAALAQVSQSLHRGSALTAGELGRMESIHYILNRKS